jgi:hypothetical protein
MSFGIDDAVSAALQVLNKFIPDPAAKAQAEGELRSALLQWDQNQAIVNAAEAANPNVWVSGWRPAIGWSCACAFFFVYTVAPVVSWIASFFGAVVPMPQFDMGTLLSLTVSLLGLGGLRTYEKLKGVASN